MSTTSGCCWWKTGYRTLPSTKKGNVSKKERLHFITEVMITYGCGIINITYFVTIYLQIILITFRVTHDVEHCKSHREFHFCECVIWSMKSIQVIKGSWTSWRIKTHHYGQLWMFCLQHFIKEIILSK